MASTAIDFFLRLFQFHKGFHYNHISHTLFCLQTAQDIDKKINVLDDDIALLNSMVENSRDNKNHDEIVSKLKIIQDMKDNTETILKQSRSTRLFLLVVFNILHFEI